MAFALALFDRELRNGPKIGGSALTTKIMAQLPLIAVVGICLAGPEGVNRTVILRGLFRCKL